MANKVTVWPGLGCTVRLEDGRVLTTKTIPECGVELDQSIYVTRRLACGDLVTELPVLPPEPVAPDKIAARPTPTPAETKPAPAADVKG